MAFSMSAWHQMAMFHWELPRGCSNYTAGGLEALWIMPLGNITMSTLGLKGDRATHRNATLGELTKEIYIYIYTCVYEPKQVSNKGKHFDK
jgi:hypothetical protein